MDTPPHHPGLEPAHTTHGIPDHPRTKRLLRRGSALVRALCREIRNERRRLDEAHRQGNMDKAQQHARVIEHRVKTLTWLVSP